jgi:hypothetical protein
MTPRLLSQGDKSPTIPTLGPRSSVCRPEPRVIIGPLLGPRVRIHFPPAASLRTIGTAVRSESELPEPARLKGLCGAAHVQHDDAGRLCVTEV